MPDNRYLDRFFDIWRSAYFDPEGEGYDYASAIEAGIRADETGHWPSREPKTGLILKGRGHETYHKTEASEKKAGYHIFKQGKRYYSLPIPRVR